MKVKDIVTFVGMTEPISIDQETGLVVVPLLTSNVERTLALALNEKAIALAMKEQEVAGLLAKLDYIRKHLEKP